MSTGACITAAIWVLTFAVLISIPLVCEEIDRRRSQGQNSQRGDG